LAGQLDDGLSDNDWNAGGISYCGVHHTICENKKARVIEADNSVWSKIWNYTLQYSILL